MVHRDSFNDLKQYFLDLDRETFGVGGGYWATFRVRTTEKCSQIPHGFKYALTMYGPGDSRIVGYDNAHTPENLIGIRNSIGDLIVTLDHRHFRDGEATHYHFVSPERLLYDFWSDVYRILKEEGIND